MSEVSLGMLLLSDKVESCCISKGLAKGMVLFFTVQMLFYKQLFLSNPFTKICMLAKSRSCNLFSVRLDSEFMSILACVYVFGNYPALFSPSILEIPNM